MPASYTPNRIPLPQRIGNCASSAILLAYGTYGVLADNLYLPSKHGGMHLQDRSAWAIYAAILCACLAMLSVVVDHYDHRDNERHYKAFAGLFSVAGWIFFGISLCGFLFARA
jgi:hypothetical protein